ncbi:PREDICTED: telomerase-binding protein EST1A-like [Acropora digitifera]|uniref:telomerase-binding protein EST1A-like n=1 Tax=Acropora digitifera TaxID=70779 RepID=UPI00077B08AF|nr:PREDICTED: telomerase-binding protein EST1A-like [Acropora digitifera]
MFENYPTFLVADTNCFVNHLNGLKAIVGSQCFTLIVPLIVINELDGLSRDFHFDKFKDPQHAQNLLESARYEDYGCNILIRSINLFCFVLLFLFPADQPITIQRNVVLMTDDRNLRVKAYTRNVPVLTVPQFMKMARL